MHLDAYALEDRSLYNPRHPLVCSCGHRLGECSFWTAVARAAGRPLHSFQIKGKNKTTRGSSLQKRWRRFALDALMGPMVSLNRSPNVRRFTGGAEEASESFVLFDAIGEVAGKQFIVDSSKNPYRFLSLHFNQPHRVKVILLARDYRAVVNSKMKRDAPLERAIRTWTKVLRQMDDAAALLPPEHVTRLTYEDLCLNTEAVMRRLCDFVGVPFTPEMLSRSSASAHHIGGSPSKFDASRNSVSLDQSHLNAFSAEQLAFMKSIACRGAERWGYGGD